MFIRNIFTKKCSGYISEEILYIMIYKIDIFKVIKRSKVIFEEKVEKRLEENMI